MKKDNSTSTTRFIFPIDGDVLTPRDGLCPGDDLDVLYVRVSVSAPFGSEILINGIRADENDGIYTAVIEKRPGIFEISAENLSDASREKISVRYLPLGPSYRISSDDNILFLSDITEKKDTYTSIFDNPYLAVYKRAHDLYGAKVHLNLLYSFNRAGSKLFSRERCDFDLSMMTDKYKSEFEENSDWLKLSFHARAEFPIRPYKHAEPEEIINDFSDVKREVLRFAGEKSFSDEVTTIHWGEMSLASVRALRALGNTALMGYFKLSEAGDPLVSYYFDVPLIEHVTNRDFYYDKSTDVTFGRIDRVTNVGELSEIMEDLGRIIKHPGRGNFVSVMIHEQFFYPDYKNYLSDFASRVLEPARFLSENGYRGCFIGEALKK